MAFFRSYKKQWENGFTPLISRYQVDDDPAGTAACLANRCRPRTPPLRGAGNGTTQNRPGSMITELMKLESRVRRHHDEHIRRLCQVHHVLPQCIYPRYRNVTNQEVGRNRQQTERGSHQGVNRDTEGKQRKGSLEETRANQGW